MNWVVEAVAFCRVPHLALPFGIWPGALVLVLLAFNMGTGSTSSFLFLDARLFCQCRPT